MPEEWKGLVVLRWIRNISDEEKNLLKMVPTPLWVKVGNSSRSMDVVPIVKMLIVVKACKGIG